MVDIQVFPLRERAIYKKLSKKSFNKSRLIQRETLYGANYSFANR